MKQTDKIILTKGDHNLSMDELFELAKPEMDEIVNYFGIEKVYNLLDRKIIGDLPTQCIYGHLTGNCNSPEVEDFIKKNVKVYIYHNLNAINLSTRSSEYLTPLEEYIYPTREEYQLEGWIDSEDTINDEFEDLYSLDSYTSRIIKVKEYLKSVIDKNN